MSGHLTRRIRLMFQAHRKQPSYPPFPSRAWLLAQGRLVELQKEFYATPKGGKMTSLLGCHWIRTHPDGRDLSHIDAMQYRSVKLFEWHWSDADACADLLAVLLRDSYILARDHPLSEQPIWSDPVGIGTRHANEWADKVHSGRYKLPTDRSFFLGRNEPDATTGDRNAIDLYTESFLSRLEIHGLRGGAFNFSTGHPRTVDGTGNTQADYTAFERSHRAIVAGHHIAVLHIYGTAAVPCAPGHYDRLKACPWQDVEWVVGEMGADEHVVGGGQHDGYLISMASNPAAYCDWLDTLIIGIDDSRIHSYQVFTYDFSHPWSSFNTREIRDALESHQWRHMQHPTKPPPVSPDPAPKPITYPPFDPLNDENWFSSSKHGTVARGPLNVRSGPGLDYPVVRQLKQGDRIIADVEVDRAGGNWVRMGSTDEYSEWVSDAYVQWGDKPPTQEPAPAPEQPPSGDCWERAYPIVLAIEGGLSLDPTDKGNYYQGKLIGTKFGISAASWAGQYDIPNLTKEQALEIYREHYFEKSGAAQLDWPLCLLHFDAFVQNESAAKKFLAASGGDPSLYLAERIDWYTRADTWDHHGRGWMRRCATMLREAAA